MHDSTISGVELRTLWVGLAACIHAMGFSPGSCRSSAVFPWHRAPIAESRVMPSGRYKQSTHVVGISTIRAPTCMQNVITHVT